MCLWTAHLCSCTLLHIPIPQCDVRQPNSVEGQRTEWGNSQPKQTAPPPISLSSTIPLPSSTSQSFVCGRYGTFRCRKGSSLQSQNSKLILGLVCWENLLLRLECPLYRIQTPFSHNFSHYFGPIPHFFRVRSGPSIVNIVLTVGPIFTSHSNVSHLFTAGPTKWTDG